MHPNAELVRMVFTHVECQAEFLDILSLNEKTVHVCNFLTFVECQAESMNTLGTSARTAQAQAPHMCMSKPATRKSTLLQTLCCHPTIDRSTED